MDHKEDNEIGSKYVAHGFKKNATEPPVSRSALGGKQTEILQFENISDESFEAMEKMCDKTASDPNSTLFEYLHSDAEDVVLADAKKRSADARHLTEPQNITEYDAEDDALQRLLGELGFEENKLAKKGEKKQFLGADMTQLEDIEAPSRLWENSLVGNTILQTSPVKMVGLLRPSTIMEAEESNCSGESSQISFDSAVKEDTASEVALSCYETAHDSSTVSNTTEIVRENENENKIKKNEFTEHISFSKYENIDETLNFIDLESTFAAQNEMPIEIVEDKSESDFDESDSIIEIISDDEEIEAEKSYSSKDNKEYGSTSLSGGDSFTNHPDYDKENFEDAEDEVPQFNDTMEEVEYVMQKAIQYKAAAAAAQCTTVIQPPLKIVQNTSTCILKEHAKLHTPAFNQNPLTSSMQKESPAHNSPKPKAFETQEKKPANCFAFNIKPIPKFDIFKKPTGTAIISNNTKQQAPKNPFAHIVSPIRAYVNNTATTPLVTAMRPRNQKNELLISAAFQQHEHKTVPYNSKTTGVTGASANFFEKTATPRTLPKKAYISSEYQQIVDERTLIKIPECKKVQKYIESALLPSVVRHDGKIKLADGVASSTPKTVTTTKIDGEPSSSTQKAGRQNASLADLSIMSGEVSMHTIMDAHKFQT